MKKYPTFINGVKQVVPNVQPGTPIYASCVVVDNLVFVSGMTAQSFDSGLCETHTAEEQTRVCYSKMKQVLENAGSSLDNLVRTLSFSRISSWTIRKFGQPSTSFSKSMRPRWSTNPREARCFRPQGWRARNSLSRSKRSPF